MSIWTFVRLDSPFNFVRPIYTTSHRVLRKQNSTKLDTPMESDSMSCVENQGPVCQEESDFDLEQGPRERQVERMPLIGELR